jgi:hypothetical protein
MKSTSLIATVVVLAAIASGCLHPVVKQYAPQATSNEAALRAKDLCKIYVIGKARSSIPAMVTFDGDNLVGSYASRKNLCWERPSGKLDLRVVVASLEDTEKRLNVYKASGKGQGEFIALHAFRGPDDKPIFGAINFQTEPGKTYYILETTKVNHSMSEYFTHKYAITIELELADEATGLKYLK